MARAIGKHTAVSLLALAVAGCAMPTSMHVRTGVDPSYADEDVRFRTTYYFRVFDACYARPTLNAADFRSDSLIGGKLNGPYVIQNDSLYRFQMTGKANALFTKINFESGTLRKEQIDPFGARITADRRTGELSYETQEETNARGVIRREIDEITRLAGIGADLKDSPAAKAAVEALLKQQVDNLTESRRIKPAAAPSPIDQLAQVQKLKTDVAQLFTAAGTVKTGADGVPNAASSFNSNISARATAARAPLDSVAPPDPKFTTAVDRSSGLAAAVAANASLAAAQPKATDLKSAVTNLQQTAQALATAAPDLKTALNSALSASATDQQIGDARDQLSKFAGVAKTLTDRGAAATKAMTDLKAAIAAAGSPPLTPTPDETERAVAEAKSVADALVQSIATAATKVGSALAIWRPSIDAQTAATNFKAKATTVSGNPGKLQAWTTKTDPLVSAATDWANAANKEAVSKSAASADSTKIPTWTTDAQAEATKAVTFKGAVDDAAAAGDDTKKDVGDLTDAATKLQTALSALEKAASPDDKVDFDNLRKAAGAPMQDAGKLAVGVDGAVSEVHAIQQQAGQNPGLIAPPAPTVQSIAAQPSVPSTQRAAPSQSCPAGLVARRGFQILGPEGWRTFDQDERLIMAMSSSASPLISTLEEVSGRILNAQPSSSDLLLPLVRERLTIVNAERTLDGLQASPPTKADDAVDRVIKSFNPGAPQ